ncbi:MAG: metal ABC transporter solute-binding protein, Zn/Mn family [Anaerolineae bacterium]
MSSRRLLLAVGGIIVLAGMWLVGCGGSEPASPAMSAQQNRGNEMAEDLPRLPAASLGEGQKLRVVATTNIVADVVGNVGGDRIELTGLLPAGADPHAYEPTPQDLRAVAGAHVIFANGVGLEAFLDKMIRNAGGDAPVVPVSQGVSLLEMGPGDDDPDHVGADPHAWFDPNNVVIWAQNIERTLAALDPANTKVYAANAQAYVAKLEALDAWIREQVAQVPAENRKIVTDHRVLGYFARAYGFELVGAVVEAYSAAAEPSAQEIVALEDNIRQFGVPAVFVGRTVNSKIAARVAEDTGIQLISLYTGSLSEAGGEASSYLDFMRYDVSAIVAALK